MRYFPKALLVAAIVLLPSLAHAQSVTGTVRDASGAVLPGVTVEAASPVLIEKVRSAVTDGSGQYRIENLLPGPYTLTFALTGFTTVKRDGVEVSGSGVLTMRGSVRGSRASLRATRTRSGAANRRAGSRHSVRRP